ncbi:SDR family NAD(P)-dependent oxidoreductase [Sciscionella sediminilitoris]|uniref:SDR family NAD(P)-dependent oxidoreductase n=1 Tax=Sciscionella sediminilitoris TaxID=1445613 RepID=UPI0004DECE16|nr:SDR family oxidoreductase [Sciscionella sp. SE31]
MSTQDQPVAVVTGASRGLGFVVARQLARKGFQLVLCARSAEGLAVAAADLRADGARVLARTADVSVLAQAKELIGSTVREYGRIDVLVTNAGVIQVGPAAAMRSEDFTAASDTLYWGTVHPVLATLPVMREAGGGRIVTITSLGGKLPAPHLLPYTAAKHAVVGFSEGLGVEVGKYGITVTTAVPGLMRTGSTRNAWFKGAQEAEHGWFAVGASLPLVSTSAATAAKKIVRATLRGRREVIVTPTAKLAARSHGLAPTTTIWALSVLDRLLPRGESPEAIPGHATTKTAAWFTALTTLDRRAARRLHQHDDQAH